jgi:hypothetical protein
MEYELHSLMRVSFGVTLQAHGVSIVDLVRPRSCRCLTLFASVVPSAALVLSNNFLTFQRAADGDEGGTTNARRRTIVPRTMSGVT